MLNVVLAEMGSISMQVVRTLLARQITRRSFLIFARDTAGYYALSEVLDTAANYNDWLKENKDSVLLAAVGAHTLTGLARNSLSKVTGRLVVPKIFSKMNVTRVTQGVRDVLSRTKYRASSEGFHVTFPNGESLRVFMRKGKPVITGNGKFVYPALLAAGFGGAVTAMTRDDWETAAQQVAAVGAQFIHDLALNEIESDCRSRNALTTLNSLQTLANAYAAQYPYLTSDEIVAKIMLTLSDEETHVGKYWLDSFVDETQRFVICINGAAFAQDPDAQNTFVRVEPGRRTALPLTRKQVLFETAIVQVLEGEVAGKHEMTHEPASNTYYSSPVVVGNLAACMAWDQNNEKLFFRVEEASMFDSALENLDDANEASLAQEIKASASGFAEWTSSIFGNQPKDAESILMGADAVASELAKGKK